MFPSHIWLKILMYGMSNSSVYCSTYQNLSQANVLLGLLKRNMKYRALSTFFKMQTFSFLISKKEHLMGPVFSRTYFGNC